MTKYYIEELGSYVGQEVQLQGWLYNKRSSGKIRFVILRDGTGIVQCVLVKGRIPDETFNSFDRLTQESSLAVRGTVRSEPRAPGGYELDLTALSVIQIAQEYPITPRNTGSNSWRTGVISGFVRPAVRDNADPAPDCQSHTRFLRRARLHAHG